MSQSPLEEQLEELAGELANEVSFYEDNSEADDSGESILVQQSTPNRGQFPLNFKNILLCLVKKNNENEPLLPFHRPASNISHPTSESTLRPEVDTYVSTLLTFFWDSVLTDTIRAWFLDHQIILSMILTVVIFGITIFLFVTNHLLLVMLMLNFIYCKIVALFEFGPPWEGVCSNTS